MTQVIPRPTNVGTVKCPACGHGINEHSAALDNDSLDAQLVLQPVGCTERDGCLWTPNDIAYEGIYGGLTHG